MNSRPTPEHGTYSRYTSSATPCRCDACKAAATEYKRKLALRVVDQFEPVGFKLISGDGWMVDAGCHGEPTELFFPEVPGRKADYSAARSICSLCPVRSECLGYAIANQISWGVWGGATPDERWILQGHEKRNRAIRAARETA